MENETIESVVNEVEGQLQDKITERKTKKKRIDLNEVIKDISAGLTLKQLANKYNVSYCAFYNYKEIKEVLQNRRNSKKEAILKQIEELIAQSLTNKEIASRLSISVVTLRKLMGKRSKRKKEKIEVVEVSKKEMDTICPEEATSSMIPAPSKPELEENSNGPDKQ